MIAKEITKIHEEFYRGNIDNFSLSKDPIKGELTVVISSIKAKKDEINYVKIINKIKKYLKKYSLKDTVNLIMETENINKKKIYDLCLKIKNDKSS